MHESGFSPRTMAAISLSIIAGLVVLGTITSTGLHDLREKSALRAKNNEVYSLTHEALTSKLYNRDLEVGELDLKRLMDGCIRRDSEISAGNEDIEVIARLSCDLKPNLPVDIDVMRVKASGYNPGIQLLMGFTGEPKLIFVRVLNHRETSDFGTPLLAPGNPWLGSLITQSKESFMMPMTADQLDAVSGATITANALWAAIREAHKILKNEKISFNQALLNGSGDEQAVKH
ncbi:MAG: FMN-binding protein [Gammaproteobacteria bacterium]